MTTLSIRTENSDVVMEVAAESGEGVHLVLDRYEAAATALRLLSALSELPAQEGELSDDEPLIQGYPSVQTAIGENGTVMLLARLHPLPTMHLLLSGDMAKNLGRELQEIASTPKGMRYQPKKH